MFSSELVVLDLNGSSWSCLHLMGWKKQKGLGSGAAGLVGMGRAPAGTSVLGFADGMWKAELLEAQADDVPGPGGDMLPEPVIGTAVLGRLGAAEVSGQMCLTKQLLCIIREQDSFGQGR